jgi:hypothetical protein
MRKLALLTCFLPAIVTQAAMAKTAGGIANPTTMSCDDFLSYDDVTKPSFVYWADGFSRAGRPDSATLDLGRVKRLVPVLIEACGKDRHAPFMKKLKETFKDSA